MPSVLATFRRRWYKNSPEPAQARGIREEEVIKPAVLHSDPTHKFVGAEEIAAPAPVLCTPGATLITGGGLSSDGCWTAE